MASAKLILLALAALVALSSAAKNYDGYQVVRVKPGTMNQVVFLDKFRREKVEFDFWKEPSTVNKPVDIMVSPEQYTELVKFLNRVDIPHTVTIRDVGLNIRKQLKPAKKHHPLLRNKKETKAMSWDQYYSNEDIYAWVAGLERGFPNIVTVGSFGTTFEGRDLQYIKIGSPGVNKNAVLIDGGIHAREWISPAFVTYVINQLTSLYGTDRDVTNYVDSLDFYIIPILNPDGYAYTWTDDRMWRKNRSKYAGDTCYGTDQNRNYGFHWDEGGASDAVCSETYHGPVPDSELETIGFENFVNGIPSPIMYLTMHSYGQEWMYPWGYTFDAPPDKQNLDELAQRGAAALEAVYGTQYTVYQDTQLYIAAGGSDDWCKGVRNIAYSYTIELRDLGTFGFTLPPGQILPTCEETWEGYKVVFQQCIDGLDYTIP